MTTTPLTTCWPAVRPVNATPRGGEMHHAADIPAYCQQPYSYGLPSILVPMDLGDSCRASVDYAIRMASRASASIVLLHVIDRTCAGGLLRSVTRRSIKAEEHDRARRCLTATAERHKTSRVPIQCLVRDGVPEYEILRLAETRDVGLIVLGRSQRGVLNRLLFGSVIGDVVECSRCPVLVVPSETNRPATEHRQELNRE
jgi:nucleotide-binding universal stress UspA family protein